MSGHVLLYAVRLGCCKQDGLPTQNYLMRGKESGFAIIGDGLFLASEIYAIRFLWRESVDKKTQGSWLTQ